MQAIISRHSSNYQAPLGQVASRQSMQHRKLAALVALTALLIIFSNVILLLLLQWTHRWFCNWVCLLAGHQKPGFQGTYNLYCMNDIKWANPYYAQHVNYEHGTIFCANCNFSILGDKKLNARRRTEYAELLRQRWHVRFRVKIYAERSYILINLFQLLDRKKYTISLIGKVHSVVRYARF